MKMAIYVDQFGYLPDAAKLAYSVRPCNYQVIRLSDQKCVLDGVTADGTYDATSGDTVYPIDFTALHEEGVFYLLSGDKEKSPTFRISSTLYQTLLKDALRCLYYQRCGAALPAKHAGQFTHPACHLTPAILLEDYLRKKANPQRFDLTGGWHDAGDYGRYASAGAVAVAHLLYAYELFPTAFTASLNIPESGNGLPDLINECTVELKWLLKMQREDGGVSHKLTAFTHTDFIMPEEETAQYLIFPVSSLATADVTGVFAMAARIYRQFDPDFADTLLAAAKRGWHWLITHEFTYEPNPEGCNTGEYDDIDDTDERLFAAIEMMRTDAKGLHGYEMIARALLSGSRGLTDFGWSDVSGFASLAVLTDRSGIYQGIRHEFRAAVLAEGNRLLFLLRNSGYRLAMEEADFVWGSNMVVENRAMLFLLAKMTLTDHASEQEISLAAEFEAAALEHLHYLLGRNPMNTSYVTGYGEHAFRHPHARVMECDGIPEPIPGWVSGGPFRTPIDEPARERIPVGTPPMKCYVDHVGSYSTNEITIYWNTPLVFLCAYFSR